MSAPEKFAWARLAAAVQDRRHELGLTQKDLEARGGPSAATVRNIEQAARAVYRPVTFRTLEQALEWPRGHCRQILAGQDEVDEVVQQVDALTTAAGLLLRVEKYESAVTDAIGRGEVEILAGSELLLKFTAFRARLLGLDPSKARVGGGS